MLQDCRGLGLTSVCSSAVAAYDEAVHAFLTQSAGVEPALVRALSLDPEFLLAHALRGFLGRLSARRVADPMVDAARAAVASSLADRGATPRERLIAAALDHLAEDRTLKALSCLDEALVGHPRDAMVVKLAHSIRFQIGLQHEMLTSIEAVMPAWSDETPGYGYILGCRAFAHGETGDPAAAELWGRAAVMRCPDDRWGAHAVAHVYEMRGASTEGLAWLDRVIAADPLTDGFHRHLDWHRALALIGLNDLDQALDAFDRKVWAQSIVEYRDVANAVSLLRRVEMAGGDVGARWDSVCSASAALLDDRRLAFADGHAIIGLIRAGKLGLANKALARLEAASAAGELSSTHYPPGALSMIRGLVAAGEAGGAALLEAALPTLDRLGGSIVQRDLFLRSAIDGLLSAQRRRRAADLLTQRARRFASCRWSRNAIRQAQLPAQSAAA